MTDVGIVEMKTPQGRKSHIAVSLGPDGTVNIVVSRTSEGEALIMLPTYAAKKLGELLMLAVDPRFGGNAPSPQDKAQ